MERAERLAMLESLESYYHNELKNAQTPKMKELLKFQRDEIIKVIKVERTIDKREKITNKRRENK